MNPVQSIERETLFGTKAKRLRLALMLTQQELAAIAGVPLEEVDLFEHNLPVRLDARRRLLKELWAKKCGTK